MIGIVTLALLFAQLDSTKAIVGYDCGSKGSNVTTISLLHVDDCVRPQSTAKIEHKKIQLLQLNDYNDVPIIQCKVEIERTVYKCAMWDYLLPVDNGLQQYLYEITKEGCKILHTTGVFKFRERYLMSDIKMNATTTRGFNFAGNADYCNGEFYSDIYGTYKNAFVQGKISITLTQAVAQVNLHTNTVSLPSGTVCTLLDGQCIDRENGYTYWDTLPTDYCNSNKYSILYAGLANKISDASATEFGVLRTVYAVESDSTTFALAVKANDTICGHVIARTEHPKLLIYEVVDNSYFINDKIKVVQNMDMFAYINSKFVYVERHIRNQMVQLYHNLIEHRCNLEREILKNSLAIASRSPDIFAYNLMKGPGYMAIVAGEVIHLIKCIPTDVTVMSTEKCYNQLPVKRNNETWFLTPKTHILIRHGEQAECSSILPNYYLINENWYKLLPRPTEAMAPQTLKPQQGGDWTYVNPASLANSGIYTTAELEKMREHISFPFQKPALLNTIARGMVGQGSVDQGGSIENLFDGNVLEKIIDNTWGKLWTKFLSFGTISAGLFGIIFIFQLVKIIVDLIIRGYTLHSIYGWSLRLMGACFASITSLLLHLNVQNPSNGTGRPDGPPEYGYLYDNQTMYKKPILAQPTSAPSQEPQPSTSRDAGTSDGEPCYPILKRNDETRRSSYSVA